MSSGWVKAAFMIAILWWVYLFFTTEIVVVYDAQGYEQSGRLIETQGFTEYLREGPQREPLFPLLVALSMAVADHCQISYHCPLKIIGLSFLLLTMFLSCRLMALMGVRPLIMALTVLYMGFSPVLTNSSLRLWSEFAVYPWVVLAVIWSIRSWRLLHEPDLNERKTAGYGLVLAVIFLLIMSVKAPAEGVLWCFLWPFYGLIFSSWRSGDFMKARQAFVFLLVVLAVFEGGVSAYKWANYRLNGHYAFTDRGDWALYGNTARRMEPLSPRRLGADVLTVPGQEICGIVFGADDCAFWSARHSDDIVTQKRSELKAQGLGDAAASKYYIHQSIRMILANPLQAFLLMAIEAHKMFFWEPSTSFVAYPDWMDRLHENNGFYYGLKFTMAFLSWFACVLAIFAAGRGSDKFGQATFWAINFIFWYMAMYSLFFILDRYSFPLISLYLTLIAFLLETIARRALR